MNRLTAVLTVAVLTASQPAAAASWWERMFGGGSDTGATPTSPAPDAPTRSQPVDIAAGLREALIVGSERVVQQLGATDGFNRDPKVHIPLPPSLQTMRNWLDRVGMAGPMDDLEVRLNRAAEAAAPKARALFVDAIRTMTIDDARAILTGGDTSATDYLRSRMSEPLAAEMRPVIDASLADVGALNLLDTAVANYRSIPFAPDVDVDVRNHVTRLTVDGIFTYLAEEERAIRANPAKRTTELLKAVFGQ